MSWLVAPAWTWSRPEASTFSRSWATNETIGTPAVCIPAPSAARSGMNPSSAVSIASAASAGITPSRPSTRASALSTSTMARAVAWSSIRAAVSGSDRSGAVRAELKAVTGMPGDPRLCVVRQHIAARLPARQIVRAVVAFREAARA
ncbi:MAG: hypothetical protein ACMVO3_17860 [Thalassobaculum sp.]